MNTDMEIRITISGGQARAGGVQMGAPSPEMAGFGAVSAGSAGAVPSPLDAFGAGELGAAPAPSPAMAGALGGASAGAAPPTPVPLDQIEQLGSAATADTGTDVAPAPEGNEG